MVSLLIVRTHTIRLWVGTLDSRSVHCCRGFGHILVEDERIELSRRPCKGPRLPLHQSPKKMAGVVGIEPTTEWLTVTWSTADLHAKKLNWLPDTDSNRNQEFWRLVCFHYTIGKKSQIGETTGTRTLNLLVKSQLLYHWVMVSKYHNKNLVNPREFESLFHPWKGCVLTVRRWVRKNHIEAHSIHSTMLVHNIFAVYQDYRTEYRLNSSVLSVEYASIWCPRRDLNSRPTVYKTAALPLCYKGIELIPAPTPAEYLDFPPLNRGSKSYPRIHNFK
jgi:hypothetical protein